MSARIARIATPLLMLAAGYLGASAARAGTAQAFSSAPAPTTPVSSDAPDPQPSSVPMKFDVQGWAEVRTGIRGRVTIAGTFSGTYDRASGAYQGAFSLTPTLAHITVLGLFPATAETDWIFTEPVTGRWRDGVLTMRAAARIHHPRLFAFGNVLIAGGANCATRRASVMELRSSAALPITDPLAGGTIATSGQGYSISALSGCGALDGLLSAVAAGGGNQATLELSPSAAS